MASSAGRISRILPRSLSSAVEGISRSLTGSLWVKQSRTYSGEDFNDPVAKVLDASTSQLDADPSMSFDSPAGSPLSDGPRNVEQGVQPTTTFPPRNYQTPRGVYKAIIFGEVGQLPIQKILKSGKSVTIFSVGTGGMFNNRRPFEGESAHEYAERSYTQWHRVAIYHERIAAYVMQRVKVGSQVYLEGNIESRVYNDPNSGAVKRIREVAIRGNGKLLFVDGDKTREPSSAPLRPRTPVQTRDEPLTVQSPEVTV